MNEDQQPFVREDLDAAQERLDNLQDALDATGDVLREHLEAADDVVGGVAFTDEQRDPLRDIALIPDMEEAVDSARELGEAINALDDALTAVREASNQLSGYLSASAEAFDANEADVCADYERAQVGGLFPPPDGYSDWAEVPLGQLPVESHYARMNDSEKFTARNGRDPRTRRACSVCHRHFRSRDWVGPDCNDCHEKSQARP